MAKYNELAIKHKKEIASYVNAKRRYLAIVNSPKESLDDDDLNRISREFDNVTSAIAQAGYDLSVIFDLAYEDTPFQATKDKAHTQFWALIEKMI